MDWQLPIVDPRLAQAWRRMWGRHLLLFLGYLVIFIALYYRMRHRIAAEDQFYWEQGILSRQLLLVMGVHLLGVVVWYRKLWSYHVRHFLLAPLAPHNLALMRILFFGFMAAHQIVFVPAHWSALAALPASARQALPLVGWMIDALPISPTLYAAANTAAIVLCFLGIFGLFTRPAMLALIPLVFYVYGVPQFFGKLSHYHFFLWVTIILAFTPCFEVWSVDAVLRRIRGMRIDRRPDLRFAVGIKLIMLTLAAIYFFSGFRKLYEIGLFWALSDNPVNLLRTEWLEQFEQVPWLRIDRWPLLCKAMAGGVILFELAYPFLLLGRRSRLFAALDAVLFHNLNGYFLQIDFVYLKTAHLSFLDWGGIVRLLRSRKRWLAWVIVIASVGILGGFVGVFFMFPVLLVSALVDLGWRMVPRLRRGRWLLGLRKRLPAPPAAALQAQRNRRWLRLSMATGTTLLLLNATCGALGIHSWPFSSYPTYSFVRGATVEYGWFTPVTADGRVLDLDAEAQAAGVRKENILPMAERIVKVWKEDAPALPQAVLACWQRWQTEVPQLRQAVQVAVEIRTLTLDPDASDKVLSSIPIGHLELIDGRWNFIPSEFSVPD